MGLRQIHIASPFVAFGMAFCLASEAAAQLDEIVVTARKREEGLQQVPVAVTAFTGAEINRRGIDGLEDLSTAVAGLFIDDQAAGQSGLISLRGVASSALNQTIDQAVSINVDGMTVSNGNVLRVGQYDLEQVEVLKGPQALFFGKNSPGGIISLRTNGPTDEFFVQGRGGYEINAKEKFGEFIVSGPVTDDFGYRAVFYVTDQEGPFENVATGDDNAEASREYFGRLTFEYDPSDAFNANVKVAYSDVDSDATVGAQRVNCSRTTGGITSLEEPLDDCEPNETFVSAPAVASAFAGLDESFRDGQYFWEQTTFISTLEMNIKPSDKFNVTAITGYYETDQNYFQEFVRAVPAAPAGGLLVPANSVTASNSPTYRTISQELRFATELDGPVNFVGGLYYEDNFASDRPCPVFFGLLLCTAYNVNGVAYSSFGQVIGDITDTLEVTAGVRYTREKKEIDAFAFSPVFGPVPFIPNERSFDNLSPEVTLAWRPDDDLTIYGAYKEGYKSGSFNTATGGSGAQNFDEELVDGGEIGVKSTWFDNTLRVNATAYRYNYSGLQVSSFDATINAITTSNAGAARIQGVELETLWTPDQIDGLTLNGAVNYNRARYTDFRQAPCYLGQTPATGCIGGNFQDLTGQQIVQAPEWTATFGASLDRSIGNGDLRYRLSADAAYSSEYFTQLSSGPPNLWDDGYFVVNASGAIYSDNDGWELSVIGRNLNNDIYPTITNNSTLGREITSATNRPRAIILQLTVRPTDLFAN